ncbi:beta-chimaerin [Culicoides brevitarsis]|uniref:beta-chimaerin n=1 Tax=Culicoides brevitarsis TaxID=469753 RepID=UPI00307C50FF
MISQQSDGTPSDTDYFGNSLKIWKCELYKLQEEAPRPIPVLRSESKEIADAPDFYGLDYHGVLGHREADALLHDKPEGSYLVRKSPNRKNRTDENSDNQNSFYTLCFKFDSKVHHFKLYYNPFLGHYVVEDSKKFEDIKSLVADGLLNHYIRKHGGPILDAMGKNVNYEQSPYMTLNRRKMRALSSEVYSKRYSNGNEEAKRATINLLNEEKKVESELKAGDIVPTEYKKQHNFKVNNFKGLNWCDSCGNFLWGFIAQGVRCDDCGFIAHEKCSKTVPPKCMPDLKNIRGVFGIDLTTLVIAYKQDIPFVVEKCVKEIEERGLKQEGIYRVSGFADEIEQVKETLDKEGNAADISEKSVSNINVVASILKMYLRLLPIPLITYQAYPALIDASNKATPAEQIDFTKKALPLLPSSHFKCLKYMIEHLQKVAEYQEVNKMSEHNLGTVFAPTLIAFPSGMTDLSQEIFLLSFLIRNCKSIFD